MWWRYVCKVFNADLNLLIALDVLLEEGSVARAARRLRLSDSAMSRTLARLRTTLGDPLLVRAGRTLVRTPRALELRDYVSRLVQDAKVVLSPTTGVDISQVNRSFTIRAAEGFVETFGSRLLSRVANDAPKIRLTFVPKIGRDSVLLREGSVDLETGVVTKSTSPEVRTKPLFRDRFVGVVRQGHPFCTERITAAKYAASKHIDVPQHAPGPVDSALALRNLKRDVSVIVGGFTTALALLNESDFVTTVPEIHSGTLRDNTYCFPLPFHVDEFTISLLWHPRFDADPVHRWLRQCLEDTCSDYLRENERITIKRGRGRGAVISTGRQ